MFKILNFAESIRLIICLTWDKWFQGWVLEYLNYSQACCPFFKYECTRKFVLQKVKTWFGQPPNVKPRMILSYTWWCYTETLEYFLQVNDISLGCNNVNKKYGRIPCELYYFKQTEHPARHLSFTKIWQSHLKTASERSLNITPTSHFISFNFSLSFKLSTSWKLTRIP